MENKTTAELVIFCPGYSFEFDKYSLRECLDGVELTVGETKEATFNFGYSGPYLKYIYILIDETWSKDEIERLASTITHTFQEAAFFDEEDLPIMMWASNTYWISENEFEGSWTLVPKGGT